MSRMAVSTSPSESGFLVFGGNQNRIANELWGKYKKCTKVLARCGVTNLLQVLINLITDHDFLVV